MKKMLFAVVAALAMTCGVVAQPTIHSNVPPTNYYQAWTWPTFTDSMGDVQHWAGGLCTDQEAYLIENSDTLTIYGIAAALSTMALLYPKEWGDFIYDYRDTSYTEVWDLLRLYVSEEDTNLRQVGADLKVHIKTTPITYYLDMGLRRIGELNHPLYPPFPIYERYYDTAVTMTDNFYIGRYFHAHRMDSTGTCSTREIVLCAFRDCHTYIPIRRAFHGDAIGNAPIDTNAYTWFFNEPDHFFSDEYPFIFPILTPNPDTLGRDTTQVDPDTLGIRSVELLKRYTSVQPNPATETAKVISSFGLTRIEAFNTAGDRIYDAPHTGYSATLDVSRWPSGTYIIRLHTPAGTVGKKLVVRR